MQHTHASLEPSGVTWLQAQAPAGLGLPVRVQAAKGGALPNGARLLSSVILVQSVQAHEGVMWVMKASRDGSLLATGGQDGAVKIWRVLPAPPVAGATPKGALIRPADLSGEDPFHTQASTSGTDLYSLSCAGGSTGGAGLQGSSTGGEDQLQTQLTLGTKPAPPPSLFDDVAAASPARGYVGPVPAIRPQPLAVLRGHSEDVVDVAWSAGGFLLTASVSVNGSDCAAGCAHTGRYAHCMNNRMHEFMRFVGASSLQALTLTALASVCASTYNIPAIAGACTLTMILYTHNIPGSLLHTIT